MHALRRTLLFVHRWFGAALAALLTVWFLSGIVMMYRGYPSVERDDHLRRAPVLQAEAIRVLPAAVFANGEEAPPILSLTTFDGRPAYVGGAALVYADDGTVQERFDLPLLDRVAAAWTGQPPERAHREALDRVDQWTVATGLGVPPLYRYSWPDGQQVYVDSTAAVIQHTTRASRFWAYAGAIPHWLYFPVLRADGGRWMTVLTWLSVAALVVLLAGLALALLVYSPRRRYRQQGQPARFPYAGWRRVHTLLGLAGGGAAALWVFSGLVSLEPFGAERWVVERTVPDGGVEDEDAAGALRAITHRLIDRPLGPARYTARTVRDALAAVPEFGAKVAEYASLEGHPVYVLTDGAGDTRIVPVQGAPVRQIDPAALADELRAAAAGRAAVEVLHAYDAYYRDRSGRLPLPVVAVRLHDTATSRYYVDPRSLSIVHSYSDREWVRRWIHYGLHSLDLPGLAGRRPLWDVVMLTFLLLGTALCATSIVLAWRVLARHTIALVGGDRQEP